jgi:hypothetical protein
MSSKEKPDYTKFMRKPATIQLSPPSDRPDSGHSSIREEDIPWAEIIEEPEPQGQTATGPALAETASKSAAVPSVGITHAPAAIGWEDQPAPPYFSYEPPPLPVLALALPLLLVLMI